MTTTRAAIAGGAVLALVTGAAGWWLLRDDGSQVPSNVHIVQSDVTGEQWIRWDDNSDGEAGFRGNVRLLRDGAVIAVSTFNTPRAGESQTPVTPFDSKYAGEGCYDAVIEVEAVMTGADVLPAEDAYLTVCIDESAFVRYQPFEYVPEPLVFPEPPPGDVLTRVIRTGESEYQLTFENATTAEWVLTTSRVYTEAGQLVHEQDLPTVSGDTPSIEIDPGEGVPAQGCFRREFVSWTVRDGVLRGWTAARQPVCLSDAFAIFPLVDNPNTPPPAPAIDVRVMKEAAGAWRIEWRDNSDGETGFELLVSVSAEGSGDFVVQKGVSAGSNETSVVVPREALALPDGCYMTTIYVFSERFDTANGIPGNITLRMCVDGADTTFEPLTR
jgi:hypothetical protein